MANAKKITDRDIKPDNVLEATEERATVALESIANSLARLADRFGSVPHAGIPRLGGPKAPTSASDA